MGESKGTPYPCRWTLFFGSSVIFKMEVKEMRLKVSPSEGSQSMTEVHIPAEVLDALAGTIAEKVAERLRPLLPPKATKRGGSGYER